MNLDLDGAEGEEKQLAKATPTYGTCAERVAVAGQHSSFHATAQPRKTWVANTAMSHRSYWMARTGGAKVTWWLEPIRSTLVLAKKAAAAGNVTRKPTSKGMQDETTRTSPDARSHGPQLIRQLVVVCAPNRVARSVIPLAEAPVLVGREGSKCVTFDLPDPEVSRIHARFEPAGQSWIIVDCGSHNGVYVDGCRVEQAELRPGSIVRLGASLLVYCAHELEQGVPLIAEREGLLGPSLAMQQVRGAIELAAPRAIPVLVHGETGVGKERVAEALHRACGRPGAFVPVNCAAIPRDLAESELFGHVQGAFTGATNRSDGLFAAADGGTLFLDEIGELPEPLQAKLLRALASGEIRAVGATTARRVDVRVIAATNRDLDAEVSSGGFRADLLARLAAWLIVIPPLRVRREDVLRIADGVLARIARGTELELAAAEALLLYDWPRNVRELEQVLGRAVAKAKGDRINVEHLPAPLRRGVPDGPPQRPPIDVRIDRSRAPLPDELREVLAHCGGRVTAVARFFDRSRRQIYRWMQQAGIDPDLYRGS